MPGTSRTQHKAEAKYNVTTEFPRLDLHFAAATGNLGLVEYALSHGQPINSVLNGVLPLHAASAGGSEVVVKRLIEEGADVNAPRLPRKYSNDKHKSSGLAVGASGSTPLHFAAANGHLAVVRLLLSHGAVPDRADKHGVTPEGLARENGWIECADMLRAWSGSRAGDLPPVDANASTSTSGCGSTSGGRESLDVTGDGYGAGSRRLHMKHSLDNAFHLFKGSTRSVTHHSSQSQLRERDRPPPSPSASSHAHAHSGSHTLFHHHIHAPHFLHHSHSASPPSSTTNVDKPLGEYTFYPSPDQAPVDGGQRRPSLPQIFGDNGHGSSSNNPGYYVGGGRGGAARARRPRSAGSDSATQENKSDNTLEFAQRSVSGGAVASGYATAGSVGSISSSPQTGSAVFGTGHGTPKKLGSKISLRNLFRRANADSSSLGIGSGLTGGSEPPSGAGSTSTSLSSSPAPGPYAYTHAHQQAGYTHNHQHHSPHRHRRTPSNSVPVSRAMSASPSAPTYGSGSASASMTPPASPSAMNFVGAPGAFRARLYSDGANALPAPRSPLAKGAELPDNSDREERMDQKTGQGAPRLSSRPSILRGHNRSASSSYNQSASGSGPGVPTMRTLRFDASSSSPSSVAESNSMGLHMPILPSGFNSSEGSVVRGVPLRGTRSASSLRHTESIGDEEDDDDEDDYGTTIDSGSAEQMGPRTARLDDSELEALELADVLPTVHNEEGPQTRMNPAQNVVNRNRGASFTSTASSSPGVAVTNVSDARVGYGEFPFSIAQMPTIPPVLQHTTELPELESGRNGNTSKTQTLSPNPDSRARGDSVSSVETSASAQSSDASAALTSVTTPSPGGEAMPSFNDVLRPQHRQKVDEGATYLAESPESSLEDLGDGIDSSSHDPVNPAKEANARPSAPIPLELDLRGISNLAEAEALAARARTAILASAALPADGPGSPNVSLSSQLATYGAILAIEKRFAKGEKQKERWDRERERGESEDDRGDESGFGVKPTAEDADADVGATIRAPQSAKEARMIAAQRRKEAALAMRQASSASATVSPVVPTVLGPVPTRTAPRSPRSATTPTRTPKMRRPHTAEGAITASTKMFGGRSPGTEGGFTDDAGAGDQIHAKHPAHARSTSTPMYVSSPVALNAAGAADIEIIETIATPVESPTSPESPVQPRTAPPGSTFTTPPPPNSTLASSPAHPHPTLPIRSRTPDPESPETLTFGEGTNGISRTGVPLTRVFTAPSPQRSFDYLRRAGEVYLRDDEFGLGDGTVRAGSGSGGRKKLAKMGFAPETGSGVGTPGSGGGLSRSPPKRTLGGLRSLVQSLKGKS